MTALPTLHGSLAKEAFARGTQGLTARPRMPAELQPTGIVEVDKLLGGGLPRSSLVELCGPSSSGRTGLCFSLLASATRQQQACAYVDVSDSLDPVSVAAAGLDLERLLWVRCGGERDSGPSDQALPVSRSSRGAAKPRGISRTAGGFRHPRDQMRGLETSIPSVVGNGSGAGVDVVARCAGEQVERDREKPRRGANVRPQRFWQDKIQDVSDLPTRERVSSRGKPWQRLKQGLRATDLLLNSGGWGVVVLDFGSISWVDVRRIPLSTWFRFQRIIEKTPTILVLLGEEPCAKGCASLALQCRRKQDKWRRVASPDHRLGIALLQGFEVEGEVLRSRWRTERPDVARWQMHSPTSRKSQKK